MGSDVDAKFSVRFQVHCLPKSKYEFTDKDGKWKRSLLRDRQIPCNRRGGGSKWVAGEASLSWLQSPMPLKPVVEKLQLGFQESQKQARPELLPHVAARCDSASQLIKVH